MALLEVKLKELNKMINKNNTFVEKTLYTACGIVMLYAALSITLGVLNVGMKLAGYKPKVDPDEIHRVEKISNCLEVRVSNDYSGRRFAMLDSQDDANKHSVSKAIYAIDSNRDGRFDEIRIQVEKGSKLEEYVDLGKLEEMYNHAAKFGTDMKEEK